MRGSDENLRILGTCKPGQVETHRRLLRIVGDSGLVTTGCGEAVAAHHAIDLRPAASIALIETLGPTRVEGEFVVPPEREDEVRRKIEGIDILGFADEPVTERPCKVIVVHRHLGQAHIHFACVAHHPVNPDALIEITERLVGMAEEML